MLPIYMTRRPLYLTGMFFYAAMAVIMFVMIVFLYPEIHPATEKILPGPVYQWIDEVIGSTESVTLTALVIVAGVVFYYLLQIEKSWNPVHYIWQIIASAVGIPRKARHITSAIRNRLEIPSTFEIVRDGGKLLEGFAANAAGASRRTIKRDWIECVYMRHWLNQKQANGSAAFFDGNSSQLNSLVVGRNSEMNVAKLLIDDIIRNQAASSGNEEAADQSGEIEVLAARVSGLHASLARLVACYAIYNNGSEQSLWRELEEFGVARDRVIRTKLSSILFIIIATLLAVVGGLVTSSVAFDLTQTGKINSAELSKTLTVWLFYTISMYCLPIFILMIIRYIAERMDSWEDELHLTFYASAFLIGMISSSIVLVIGQIYVPADDQVRSTPPDVIGIYLHIWLWTIAPGILTAFVAYRMDEGLPLNRHGKPSKARAIMWGTIVGGTLVVVVGVVLLVKWDDLSASPAIANVAKFAFTAECTVFAIGFIIGAISGIGLVRTTPTALDIGDRPTSETLPPGVPAA